MRALLDVLHTPRGLSTTTVLIVVGIASGLPAIILTSQGYMLESMRDSAKKSDSLRLMSSIQQIFLQRQSCQGALKSAAGTHVVWNNSQERDIGTIETVDPVTLTPSVLASSNINHPRNIISSDLRISRIFLRPRADGAGAFYNSGGNLFRAYRADLVVNFISDTGRSVRPESVTINIATNTTTQTVTACPAAYQRMAASSCMTPGASCESGDGLQHFGNPNCSRLTYMSGFSNGTPVCRCVWSCSQ